jgi:mRNA interferase MazF
VTTPAPRRGEVWLARLDKVRPIVVLSRDPMGRVLRSVISAPVTSTIRGLSTEVRLGAEDGIRLESVANLDNVQLVARERLVRRVGRVRPGSVSAICQALAIATGCDQSRG